MRITVESKFNIGDKIKVITEYIENPLDLFGEIIEAKQENATVVGVKFVAGFEYLVEFNNKPRVWVDQKFCRTKDVRENVNGV